MIDNMLAHAGHGILAEIFHLHASDWVAIGVLCLLALACCAIAALPNPEDE